MTITRYKRRFWAVHDLSGALVCVCVYRKGARELVRRLTAPIILTAPATPHTEHPERECLKRKTA